VSSTGVHPATYPMNMDTLSPGIKWQGREADHSPLTSVEVKKTCVYASTPLYTGTSLPFHWFIWRDGDQAHCIQQWDHCKQRLQYHVIGGGGSGYSSTAEAIRHGSPGIRTGDNMDTNQNTDHYTGQDLSLSERVLPPRFHIATSCTT
jgi:hypothetical protein